MTPPRDWSADIAKLPMPVLLAFADNTDCDLDPAPATCLRRFVRGVGDGMPDRKLLERGMELIEGLDRGWLEDRASLEAPPLAASGRRGASRAITARR